MLKPLTVYVKSLGCHKNHVDSEIILSRFMKSDWSVSSEPEYADVIIVNTCAFIEDAIDESIEEILKLAEYKKKGSCKKLIIAGCLPQRFKDELITEIPEGDIFLGTGILSDIKNIAENIETVPKGNFRDPYSSGFYLPYERIIEKNNYTRYIKIAEGCGRFCAYCIIPKIRGKYRSRSIEEICAEASFLEQNGAKEIVLVSQESSFYGKDLKKDISLTHLLRALAKSLKKAVIRVLYSHPETMDDELIKTVSETENICSYFDIPIQHVSDSVLKKMGRKYTKKDLLTLFGKIRKYAPSGAIRTTLILGFPGETEKDFKILYDFIKEIEFDHLGAFIYSDGEDIASHKFPFHVNKKTAEKRRDIIMKCQREISYNKNKSHIGKKYKALIEKKEKDYIARTWFQASEIDGVTFVRGENLKLGEFSEIFITDAMQYDIIGKPI